MKANAPNGLPSGSYHPRETIAGDEMGTFQGGPGGWMLYRYTDSPVGPYDEVSLCYRETRILADHLLYS
jgi:hypothetical protein